MITALMCVYNEAEFIDYAIKSCLPFVDNLVIIEGAYEESIKIGASPRSNDGTIEIIKKYLNDPKIIYREANEKSDPQQRNVGLELAKKFKPDFDDETGHWLLIIDGDEVYKSHMFRLIRNLAKNMQRQDQCAAYFQSLTFVNSFNSYCVQSFPRLFRVTDKCQFIDDNYMNWGDLKVTWQTHNKIVQYHTIEYYHYAFCKSDLNRFKLKKTWWETRFGKHFDYGWKIDESGKITDKNHRIYEFAGKHPDLMQGHPLYVKT